MSIVMKCLPITVTNFTCHHLAFIFINKHVMKLRNATIHNYCELYMQGALYKGLFQHILRSFAVTLFTLLRTMTWHRALFLPKQGILTTMRNYLNPKTWASF